MRIGILTFHHTTNYGGSLQAVSLSCWLRKHGWDAEVIDYRPIRVQSKHWERRYRIKHAIQFASSGGYFRAVLEGIRHGFREAARLSKMNRFVEEQAPTSPGKGYTKRWLKSIAGRYDCLIVGSDEVWRTARYGAMDYSFLLDFARPGTARISYAASVGPTKDFGGDETGFRRELLKYRAIGVRDVRTMGLVGNLGLTCEMVCDPGFFLNTALAIDAKIPSGYAVMLGSETRKYSQQIKSYCRENNLKLYGIGELYKGADENLTDLDQGQWLGMIKNSSIVFTSLFHGTVFSMLYEKDFVAISSMEKRGKMTDLLEKVFLSRRLYNGTEDFSDWLIQESRSDVIDYYQVRRHLDEMRESSWAWLGSVLNAVADELRVKKKL